MNSLTTHTHHKSPFKFLEPFGKEDFNIFFGRKTETEKLYELVQANRLTLLYGASGTGKTSLINCGLSNTFTDTDWFSISIRGSQIAISETTETRAAGVDFDLKQALYTHINKHTEESIGIAMPIQDALEILYLETFTPIYLIFDQFEELFIQGTDSQQQAFFTFLKEILEVRVNCRVILSMREAYLAHLSEYEKDIPSLLSNRLRIEKMSGLALQEMLCMTLQLGGIHFGQKQVPYQHTEWTTEQLAKMKSACEQPSAESGFVLEAIIENVKDVRKEIDLGNLQIYLDHLYKEEVSRQEEQQQQLLAAQEQQLKQEKDAQQKLFIQDKINELKNQSIPKVSTFDTDLVARAGDISQVMASFLEKKLLDLESDLSRQSSRAERPLPPGIPLKVLVVLVSADGNQYPQDRESIQDHVRSAYPHYPDWEALNEAVNSCIERFETLRILRPL